MSPPRLSARAPRRRLRLAARARLRRLAPAAAFGCTPLRRASCRASSRAGDLDLVALLVVVDEAVLVAEGLRPAGALLARGHLTDILPPSLADSRCVSDPVFDVPREVELTDARGAAAVAPAPAPARLPDALSRRLGERARRRAQLHRADVARARARRRRSGSSRCGSPTACRPLLRPPRRDRGRPLEPPEADGRRRPRPRARRSSRSRCSGWPARCRSGGSSWRRSCSRRRRATSRRPTARRSRRSSTARTSSRRTRSSQATAQALSIGGWALAARAARVPAALARSSPSTRRRSSSRRC